MVTRYWSARAPRDAAPEYARHFAEHVLPVLQRVEGYVSATLLQREVGRSIEIVVLTYWQSLDAIRGFAGDDLEIAVVSDDAAALFSDYDRRVRHYDVVMTAGAEHPHRMS
jgi:heme-degrading monooxygenase HmoA